MEGVKASVASNPGPCVCYMCVLGHLSSQVGLGDWIDGPAGLPFQGMSSIPGMHVKQFIITCDSSSRGPDALTSSGSCTHMRLSTRGHIHAHTLLL